jgi:hypothetical protein
MILLSWRVDRWIDTDVIAYTMSELGAVPSIIGSVINIVVVTIIIIVVPFRR